MQPLARKLADLPALPILVAGDLILDCYIDGTAGRVSPEAPVLVFETGTQRDLLGGACNVAANLVALGARASVLGVVGADAAGEQLLDLMRRGGIDTGAVARDPSRPTTRKTRFVSRTAQILRVDEEKRHKVDGQAADRLLATLAQRPFPFRGVLLSDYGKGVLGPNVIQAAVAAGRAAGVPIVVDPKGRDYTIYRGVDLLTPNREEAEAATGIAIGGMADLRRVAARMREITGVKTVTVTLGKDGIFYETPEGEAHVIPTQARAVFDVTGAGDTVIAVLTLTQAAGLPIADSLRLANIAAGIVVGRFGTWAVSRREMLEVMGERGPGKVLEPDEAISVAARLRVEGKRLVFTNGCFDIIHSGHTTYLQRARAYGDALMVAVNTDASVRRQGKSGDRPINPLAERMAVLAALQSVDYVVPFDDDTPLELIRAVTPHVLTKGEDWRDKGVVGREWVESHGGQVVLVPLVPGRSTTSVVERIRKGAG
jgi:D-beta-D-heptose 7-phosphate kinase/D-beta-D-heptose 1-phosphate adenosyltransferase